jgi:hypothetical protein
MPPSTSTGNIGPGFNFETPVQSADVVDSETIPLEAQTTRVDLEEIKENPLTNVHKSNHEFGSAKDGVKDVSFHVKEHQIFTKIHARQYFIDKTLYRDPGM